MTFPKILTDSLVITVIVLFIIITVDSLKSIHRDTTKIRKTIESNEVPVDPFCVVNAIFEKTTYNTRITRQLDTLQFLCAPKDTTRLQGLLYTSTRECGFGHCTVDSLVKIQIEYIE